MKLRQSHVRVLRVLIVPGACLHYSHLHGVLVVRPRGCLLTVTTAVRAEHVPFHSIPRGLEGDSAHSRQSNIQITPQFPVSR